MLEESSFPNRKADYFWLLLLSSLMLLVFLSLSTICGELTASQALSPLFNLPFLSSSLAFVPIYLWSRRHPSTPISLFGLFTITAPYLPVALVAFSWILNGTWKAAAGDLVGCAVGHVGWFLRDVWTREMLGGSSVFSDAPIRL
jgi:Derlin-2/3